MAELSDYQKDILIRTALGEARGEGVEGMADVIQTIFNRANDPRFPSDPAAAALENKQYSTWNTGAGGNNPQQFSKDSDIYKRAERALELVTSGTRPDYTGGAVFYKTPAVNSPFHDSQNKYGTIERNGHLYYPTRPVPPGEIPNTVASALSVTQPRVAPNPATQSPDLAQMRNPIMSSSARNAQVTPSGNAPLPRPRPSAPDIVTPTMASLNAQRPNVNASRAGDMLAASKTPYTPRLTDAGDNIYSYHIPDMTPTAIVGGIGSLTPNPARQRLPDIHRTVPGQSQIERAAANVRPAAPAASPSTVAPAQNMLSRDSVANAALGQRVATQMGQAFNPPENVPTRLVPKPIVQPTNVTRNQPPIQVVPAPQPQMRSAPVPALMSQGLAAQRMPLMGSQQMGGGLPLMRSQPVSQAPLRVTVSGANSYSSPAATPVQSLQSQGLSASDAYALANQQSRERAYERVNGPDTRSDWFRDVTGG